MASVCKRAGSETKRLQKRNPEETSLYDDFSIEAMLLEWKNVTGENEDDEGR